METQKPAIKSLIEACRNGEFEVVKEIVERTGIDVNSTTEFFHDGPLFQLLDFPLFAAAGKCNLQLIDQPDVTLLLIELGMSVTQKSYLTDITLLHRWAASSDPAAISIIELALSKGADVKVLSNHRISPLNMAAIGLPSNEFTLIIPFSYHSPNDPVLRLLLNRCEYSLSEKIDALELAGAMLILNKIDESSISQAFQYWNEALDLRESAQGSIPKVPVNPTNIVHWRAVEWTTKDQLRELQIHPSVDRIKMQQAILVAQRILSRMSYEALLGYLWYELASNYCGALYFGNHISELLDVCWVVFEGARLHDTRQWMLYWYSLEKLTAILLAGLKKLKIDRNPILSSETLMLSLELITDTDISHLPGRQSALALRKHTGYMYVIYDLISMISELPEMITPEIKSCLERFVRRNGRNK